MSKIRFKAFSFGKIQKFSKAIMLPISILPIAGLILGVSSALSDPTTIFYLNSDFIQEFIGLLKVTSSSIFKNIPIIFAVGVAVGFAKSEKGVAALNSIISYLIFNITINYYLKINNKLADPSEMASVGQGIVFGVQSISTGIFGSIIIGVLSASVQNRFLKKKLPRYLAFFSGPRFLPFIMIPYSVILGIFFYTLWPGVNGIIVVFASFIYNLGAFGSFAYTFFHRLLVPLGLHSILSFPFNYTSLGGTEIVNGEVYEGIRNIFYAQLSDPSTTKFYGGLARYGGGYYIILMFGLPGAAYGIYKGIGFSDKKKIAALLLTGALTSFLTGITEPIEFLFVFTAPILYFIHCFYSGLASMFVYLLDVTVGDTFSDGFLDFLVFGVLQGNAKTNWIFVPILGVPFFFLYYFTFKFCYSWFDFTLTGVTDPILGEVANNKGYLREKAGQLESFGIAKRIIKGLGGLDNIEELDSCATRLRVTVYNNSLVDAEILKKSGAMQVMIINNGVQVIYGADVYFIRSAIEEYYPGKFFDLSSNIALKEVKEEGIDTYIGLKEEEKNPTVYVLDDDKVRDRLKNKDKPHKDDFTKL